MPKVAEKRKSRQGPVRATRFFSFRARDGRPTRCDARTEGLSSRSVFPRGVARAARRSTVPAPHAGAPFGRAAFVVKGPLPFQAARRVSTSQALCSVWPVLSERPVFLRQNGQVERGFGQQPVRDLELVWLHFVKVSGAGRWRLSLRAAGRGNVRPAVCALDVWAGRAQDEAVGRQKKTDLCRPVTQEVERSQEVRMSGSEQAAKRPCVWVPAAAGAGVLLAVVAWFVWHSVGPVALCLASWTAGAVAVWLGARAAAVCAARSLHQSGPVRLARWTLNPLHPLLQAARRELLRQRQGVERERDERVQLEALVNLRNQKLRRLELVLDTLQHPVLVTDPQDELLYVNRAARRLLQASAAAGGQAAGEPYEPCNAAAGGRAASDRRTSETLRIDHAGHTGAADQEQFDLRSLPALHELVVETRTRRDATPQRTRELEMPLEEERAVYRATAVNVYDDRGVYLGVVTVLSDIRDERLAKTRHAEFVSAVSHEMKTPLSSVKAFVEMLQDGDVVDPEEQRELLGFIEMQVDRLTRMINEMLNLARIESGVIKVQRENCDLNEVLQKAAEVVRPVAEDKRQRFVTELSELYLPVYADRELLGQAVVNLLSNAVKYTPEGGTVRLRSRLDEDVAVIEVQDTGIGIPEEALPHVFDRFYRVPQNNKAASGTGLGLALVHYIVTDVHNGSISVTSKVDQGTCFSVRLPLGHVESTRKDAAGLCAAAK